MVQKRWWRGVLVLYAQMADEIEHIIQDLGEYGWGDEARETINMMISRRPEEERDALRDLMRAQVGAQDMDRRLGMFETEVEDEDSW